MAASSNRTPLADDQPRACNPVDQSAAGASFRIGLRATAAPFAVFDGIRSVAWVINR